MAKWCVVIRQDTGEAVSYCTQGGAAPAEVLAAKGLEVIELGECGQGIDFTTRRWDPTTRRLQVIDRIDRLDDLATAPALAAERAMLEALPADQQALVRRLVGTLLGQGRSRRSDDPVVILPER